MNQLQPLSPAGILDLLPQQPPFRFVDEILEVDREHIVGRYTFRPEHDFYRGHFPGRPLTPGVILLESMCQVGVVCQGIYLGGLELPPEERTGWLTLFSDAEVEFSKAVYPGETVTIRGDIVFWRRKKIRSRITMHDNGGALVATATASGVGVRHEQ